MDVEVELENTLNQTILQYKDLVEKLTKDILQMKNLAMQVKYENQASMQILELRQNTIQTLNDIKNLYDVELIGSMDL